MASIHRTKKSRYWYAAFYLPDGRRTFRSTGTTDKRRAKEICVEFDKASRLAAEGRLTENRAREVIADIFAIGNQSDLPSASVKEYLESWLKKKSLELAESSFSDYGKATRLLLEHLHAKSDKPMDAVTSADVVAFRGKLSARVAGATVNKTMKILQGAWTEAGKDGLVRENLFSKVGTVKVRNKKHRRAFSLPELKSIVAVCPQEWRGMVLFGMYTGQRLTDLARLTWQSVDVVADEIRLITRKTDRPMVIPMAKPVRDYLAGLKVSDNPSAPIFPGLYKLDQATLSRHFHAVLASVGLVEAAPETHNASGKGRDSRRSTGGLSFHCLRHTATSLLKNAGVSDVVAREIIGHDSEAVSRAYTHIEADTLRKAVAELPDIMQEG